MDAATRTAQTSAADRPQGMRRQALRRFLRHRLAVFGLFVLFCVITAAVLGPLLFALDPITTDYGAIRQPPGPHHLLGADLAGRDVLSRVVFGARTSLIVGFGAVGLYMLIGTSLGLLSGYYGGVIDQLIMRFTDVLMSVPLLLLIIVFVSLVGPSLESVLVIIGVTGWPGVARFVRAQVLALREAEFITAARVIGLRDRDIIVRHLLPNTFGPLTVLATFGVAGAILAEAGLSFLGLGVRPPAPSLGTMVNEARSTTVLQQMPWLWLSSGLVIAFIVVAVNFVGDGLRDALDPRSTRVD